MYKLYEAWLRRGLDRDRLPEHIALVMDGNRRWARDAGFDNPSIGHRYGAEHLDVVLGWCARLGIRHASVYVASSDNLRKRGGAEVDFLMGLVERVIAERLMRPDNRWRLHLAGNLEHLPEATAEALRGAHEATRGRSLDHHLTVAIGYDGQEEIVDAVRSLIHSEIAEGSDITDTAERVGPGEIAAHLHTAGLPEPDLVIRTSGEHRMSSFLPWQTTRSELFFTDVFWPGFRHIDFLRGTSRLLAAQAPDRLTPPEGFALRVACGGGCARMDVDRREDPPMRENSWPRHRSSS
nr:polyprenyl diphosphate synthase [Glycomyces sp. L485]